MTKRRNKKQSNIVQTIRSDGCIKLGEQYANQQVIITQIFPGAWKIQLQDKDMRKELNDISQSAAKDLQKAISWAIENPPAESDIDSIFPRENEKGDH